MKCIISCRKLLYYPNPDIESRNRERSLGMFSESKKYVTTSLVVMHFLDLLSVLRGCAVIVFSILGLGYYQLNSVSSKRF